eukprot:7091574-Heterocapsa_arctica.AAC.1
MCRSHLPPPLFKEYGPAQWNARSRSTDSHPMDRMFKEYGPAQWIVVRSPLVGRPRASFVRLVGLLLV